MAVPVAINVAAAYNRRLVALRSTVTRAVEAQWDRLDNWRTEDITRFAKAVAPIVEAGQAQVATLTDAYLAQFEASALDERVRPVGVRPALVTVSSIRGVPTAEVYYRVGPTVWYGLSKGLDLNAAVAKARARLASMVAVDLQLAKTHTARTVLASKDNVTGFTRVTHGTCNLCLSTAHERYAVDELLPIHPGCNCDVAPVYDGKRPIKVTDPDKPSEKVDVGVRKHGELGPLLVNLAMGFAVVSKADREAASEKVPDELGDDEED